MPEPISLAKYWDMLNKHDWFYDYSDDGEVYRRGVKALDNLVFLSGLSTEHSALFNEFHAHMFSGKPWNTEKKPKPERPKDG